MVILSKTPRRPYFGRNLGLFGTISGKKINILFGANVEQFARQTEDREKLRVS